ncbi:TetR/AcrR family transcriptional regulator [Amycolatopsis regifaucium]|uniref:TetR family transcriptional regulator n=1 Tax=Amycolatopsis regifaucium TaxID=546365 RepID=A0A154M9K8_9PSEU|nr:TetR/AcrR family transcriptional regulator [Amycolatopsis regifaucium]KZB81328.1 TetR family transcriptional regulator [Amycolatopsis regifaucium]OKA04594.1 TetR family transcriptional regulator [Amycolatopsis regifaucium]SFH34396.1 transcriptional regulator, TetR family [Amycolatopsis regifaucium]
MPRPKGFDPTEVLDAAVDTFWRKGYAATSAQDLVDGTGLGRGSLYHSFSGKQQLFSEALRRYEETSATRVEEMLAAPGTIRARIRRVLMDVVEDETNSSAGHRGCLAVNAALELGGTDEEVTARVRHNFQRVEDAFHVEYVAARQEGEIGASRDPRALARFTLAAMYGLRVLGKTADRQVLTQVVETTVQAL